MTLDLVPLVSITQLFVSRTNFFRALKGKINAVTLGKSLMKKKKMRPVIRFTKLLNEEENECL